MKNEENEKQEWVLKRLEFAYPIEGGKTEVISFDIYAKKEDAEKFDKWMNMLRSLHKALGLKEIPIYDFKEVKDGKSSI